MFKVIHGFFLSNFGDGELLWWNIFSPFWLFSLWLPKSLHHLFCPLLPKSLLFFACHIHHPLKLFHVLPVVPPKTLQFHLHQRSLHQQSYHVQLLSCMLQKDHLVSSWVSCKFQKDHWVSCLPF